MVKDKTLRRRGAGAWVAALVLLAAQGLPGAASAAQAAPITLDTHGGDTWSFSQTIAGEVRGEACAQVVVRAPLGETRAPRQGARFVAEVALRAGENPVQAICLRGGTELARSEPVTWTVRAADVPVARIAVTAGADVVTLSATASAQAPGQAAPLVRFEWDARADNPALLLVAGDVRGLPVETDSDALLHIEKPEQDGEYYVTLRVTDARGRTAESTAVFVVEDGAARAVDLATWAPAWVDEAVVYGVVPYFFGERGFDAVRARLDDIAALGVTTLWLSPVTEPAPNDFGYAVRDHFAVRADYGGETGLRALIEGAHARGLRVLLDFVPSHLSDQHPYHRDAERHDERSPYYAWFDRDPRGEITHYFDWHNLKNLDYDNPEVRAYVIAAAAHWVREYGIDGFRVDASWAVSDRAPGFWQAFRAALKHIKPDIMLLAEASAREPQHRAHFDAAYDWTSQLGQWAWDAAFSDGEVDLAHLSAALTHPSVPPALAARTLRFLNNNDTGARFITRHGLETKKVAAALTFTLPGIPLIYTGDEVGAQFEPYGPRPAIDWDDPHGLRTHYAQLAALRAQHDALRGVGLRLVEHDQQDAVLAFVRQGKDGNESALVVLNFSAQARTVALANVDLTGTRLEPLVGDAAIEAGARVRLSAYGGALVLGVVDGEGE